MTCGDLVNLIDMIYRSGEQRNSKTRWSANLKQFFLDFTYRQGKCSVER